MEEQGDSAWWSLLGCLGCGDNAQKARRIRGSQPLYTQQSPDGYDDGETTFRGKWSMFPMAFAMVSIPDQPTAFDTPFW